jgi:DNA ligase (NAD+)
VERIEGEAAMRCSGGLVCSAQLKAAIWHFASRRAMDIDGLGDKLIDQLVERELVRKVSDLFSLRPADLQQLDRMGEKSSQKLVDAIAASRETTLPRFIFALGIREVGEATAEALASHFGSFDALRRADEDTLVEIQDVGPVVARHVVAFFASAANREVIEKLLAAGITWPEVAVARGDGPLAGETWVVTGRLEAFTREDAEARLKALGARTAKSVSSRTTVLLAGPGAGSKLKKAEELGVEIIDEAAFLERAGIADAARESEAP